jgi:hypothetical protein
LTSADAVNGVGVMVKTPLMSIVQPRLEEAGFIPAPCRTRGSGPQLLFA